MCSFRTCSKGTGGSVSRGEDHESPPSSGVPLQGETWLQQLSLVKNRFLKTQVCMKINGCRSFIKSVGARILHFSSSFTEPPLCKWKPFPRAASKGIVGRPAAGTPPGQHRLSRHVCGACAVAWLSSASSVQLLLCFVLEPVGPVKAKQQRHKASGPK